MQKFLKNLHINQQDGVKIREVPIYLQKNQFLVNLASIFRVRHHVVVNCFTKVSENLVQEDGTAKLCEISAYFPAWVCHPNTETYYCVELKYSKPPNFQPGKQ